MPGLPAKFFTSTVASAHTLSRLLAARTLSPAYEPELAECRVAERQLPACLPLMHAHGSQQ